LNKRPSTDEEPKTTHSGMPQEKKRVGVQVGAKSMEAGERERIKKEKRLEKKSFDTTSMGDWGASKQGRGSVRDPKKKKEE